MSAVSMLVSLLLASSALADDSAETDASAEVPPPEAECSDDAPCPDELARRIDVLAKEIERLRIGEAAVAADQSVHGMGPAASRVYRAEPGVSLGGYGEVKYHHYAAEAQDGSPSGAVDQVDVHRLILYAGYKFDDRWVLNTEIEFEHVREVYVEFAYLDFQALPSLGMRGGLLLMPMGITNELHEPTTFLSVDRPQVERYILPSTWREIGLGVYGDAGPVSYRAYLIDGMDASGFDDAGLRGGRQKGAKALAEDFAGVGRVDYVGLPGLVVGGSAYYGHSGQGLQKGDGGDLSVPTLIYEAHATLDIAGLEARALFAGARVDQAAALSDALERTEDDGVARGMYGWYAEIGYDVLAPLGIDALSLTPHVRYEALDTQAVVPAGYTADPSRDRSNLTVGLACQPHDQIVLKADYQWFMNQAETGVSQVDAGIGFIF